MPVMPKARGGTDQYPPRLVPLPKQVDGMWQVTLEPKDGGTQTCCAGQDAVNAWRSVVENVIRKHGAPFNFVGRGASGARQSHRDASFNDARQNAIFFPEAKMAALIFTIPYETGFSPIFGTHGCRPTEDVSEKPSARPEEQGIYLVRFAVEVSEKSRHQRMTIVLDLLRRAPA